LRPFKDPATSLAISAFKIFSLEPAPQRGHPNTALLGLVQVLVQPGGQGLLAPLSSIAFHPDLSSVFTCHHRSLEASANVVARRSTPCGFNEFKPLADTIRGLIMGMPLSYRLGAKLVSKHHDTQ